MDWTVGKYLRFPIWKIERDGPAVLEIIIITLQHWPSGRTISTSKVATSYACMILVPMQSASRE